MRYPLTGEVGLAIGLAIAIDIEIVTMHTKLILPCHAHVLLAGIQGRGG